MPEKKENEILYAALKFIEALHHDGHIPDYMFKNILDEYANQINTADFKIKIKEMKGD